MTGDPTPHNPVETPVWFQSDIIQTNNLEASRFHEHYDDVIMGTIASQITSLTIVYSTVYSGADQSKHQSSASLAFVWGIHRGPVNSPHKWPVTRKLFPFDDVIMILRKHAGLRTVPSVPPDQLTHWGRVTHICVSKLNKPLSKPTLEYC